MRRQQGRPARRAGSMPNRAGSAWHGCGCGCAPSGPHLQLLLWQGCRDSQAAHHAFIHLCQAQGRGQGCASGRHGGTSTGTEPRCSSAFWAGRVAGCNAPSPTQRLQQPSRRRRRQQGSECGVRTCHLRHVRSETTSWGNPLSLYTELRRGAWEIKRRSSSARRIGGPRLRSGPARSLAAASLGKPLSKPSGGLALEAQAAAGTPVPAHRPVAHPTQHHSRLHPPPQNQLAASTQKEAELPAHLYLPTSCLATAAISARSVAMRSPA